MIFDPVTPHLHLYIYYIIPKFSDLKEKCFSKTGSKLQSLDIRLQYTTVFSKILKLYICNVKTFFFFTFFV